MRKGEIDVFVSHAQNFEDVMLDRVFRDERAGFYIDVGAWHPDKDSVTRHFYEKGWSGINIEPARSYFRLLQRQRTRDINLNVAIGRESGELDFVEVPGSAMSSLKPEAVERARRHGFASRSYRIPVMTLKDICAQHCAGREIAFLKIDVEGLEKEVIESLDWAQSRPVVVVVEAVHPDTRQPDWSTWEPALLAAGYTMVWFDGLNRYYLRGESAELAKHFVLPPNLFDGFVLEAGHPMTMRTTTRLSMLASRLLPAAAYRMVESVWRSLRRLYHSGR